MRIKHYIGTVLYATAALAWLVAGYIWDSRANEYRQQAAQASQVEEKVQLEALSNDTRKGSDWCLLGGGTFFLASLISGRVKKRKLEKLEETVERTNRFES